MRNPFVFTAQRRTNVVYATALCPCACLCVCHNSVCYQNGKIHDHANNTAQ